jgi:hypothetical protein
MAALYWSGYKAMPWRTSQSGGLPGKADIGLVHGIIVARRDEKGMGMDYVNPAGPRRLGGGHDRLKRP